MTTPQEDTERTEVATHMTMATEVTASCAAGSCTGTGRENASLLGDCIDECVVNDMSDGHQNLVKNVDYNDPRNKMNH